MVHPGSIHDQWPRHGVIREQQERPPGSPFGARVRAFRKLRGWTQVALGARIGLTQQAIQQIERGRHRPTLYTVTQLADALGVRPQELAGVGLTVTDPDRWLELWEALDAAQGALNRVRQIARALTVSPE